MSLIFVGQSLGFVFAAVFVETIRTKIGTGKTLCLAQTMTACGFIPLIATAPFAIVAVSFSLVGFGLAINCAISNTFCAGLQNGTMILGLLHGSYGIGGTSGPLIATAMVAVAGAVWGRYYIITAGLGIMTAAVSLWSFSRYEGEQGSAMASTLTEREREDQVTSAVIRSMLGSLKSRVVLVGAIFIFAYQGAEVSISGWVISFLINARGGDPSSVGYVSAGFWAGITIGRFCLSHPAHKIGEKLFVFSVVAGAIAFQILVWWVPNIVGDAVAVSIVGLLLGPIYPCAAAVFMRSMSRKDQVNGMGTISACGSLGGAVAPFTTGLLAQAVGPWVLHPIVIALFVMMLVCWYAIPAEPKRTE